MSSKNYLSKGVRKFLKKVGDNLRCARLRRGFSQAELAKKINITQYHISRMEWGDQQLSLGLLYRFCKALNVMPQEMVDDTMDGRFWVNQLERKGGDISIFNNENDV